MCFCRACCNHGQQKIEVPLPYLGFEAGIWTRLGDFKRHANSKMHQNAAIQMSKTMNPGLDLKVLAPQMEHMEELLKDFKANKNMRTSYTFVGPKKLRKMLWCLGECLGAQTRQVFTETASVALRHDVGDTHLSVKYSMALKSKRKVGFLGNKSILKAGGHLDTLVGLHNIETNYQISLHCSGGSSFPKPCLAQEEHQT